MISVDQIQKTFIVSDKYPAGIVCLASVMGLYDDIYSLHLLAQFGQSKKTVTLEEIKTIAIHFNFDANVRIMTIEQLMLIQIPAILCFTDELGKTDFVVCYGFDGKRFVVGEPSFGLMQYTSEEMERMWVNGIIMRMFMGDS